MSTSTDKLSIIPLAASVDFSDVDMRVRLLDGREISVPLDWFPKLKAATDAQRANYRLIGKGVGIHFPDLDEDISTEALLAS